MADIAPVSGESLDALLQRLEIASYDLLLVGDGSGSKWGYPVGWACVAILPNTLERKLFYGGCSDATVNFAELMAYMAPLTWFAAQVAERKKTEGTRIYDIHILTDSSYTANEGEKLSAITMHKNTALWAAFSFLEHRGLRLHWHWIRRETVDLNLFADSLSKAARGLILNNDVATVSGIIAGGLDPQKLNRKE